jgi:hypothetical protein
MPTTFPNCPSTGGKLIGRYVKLEAVDGCAEARPEEADWLILGALTDKTKDYSPGSVSSEADDTGGIVETLQTNLDLEVGFSGEVLDLSPAEMYGLERLELNLVTRSQAMKQPGLWIRITEGDVRMSFFAVITGLSTSGGTNDIRTYDGTFKVSRAETLLIERLSELPVGP